LILRDTIRLQEEEEGNKILQIWNYPPIACLIIGFQMSLALYFNAKHVTTINVDAYLGKENFKHLHADAVYLSNPQFRIYKLDKEWMVEHCSAAKNETVIDGKRLLGATPLVKTCVVTVGNSSKNIFKFPLTIKLVDPEPILAVNSQISQEFLLHTHQHEIISHAIGAHEVCDFCGRKNSAQKAIRLKDFRVRCQVCSERAVDSESAANKICNDTLLHMQSCFSLPKFKHKILIEFVSAALLAKKRGVSFVPTENYDARSTGFAYYQYSSSVFGVDDEKFSIHIEQGFPPEETMMTVVHELTHIWQFENLDHERLEKANGGLLSEGHPCYAEVAIAQFLQNKAHTRIDRDLWENAMKLRMRSLESDDSEYGRGYRLLLEMIGSNSNVFQFMLNNYAKK